MIMIQREVMAMAKAMAILGSWLRVIKETMVVMFDYVLW